MRFTALDSWRGICALLVAVFHFGLAGHYSEVPLVKGAFLFVDFFFVLSGFVMMQAYGGRLEGRESFLQFLIRRFGRLWPLHMAMLSFHLLYVAVRASLLHSMPAAAGSHAEADTAVSFVADAFLLHSMGLFNHLTWNAPSWSISAEFWAYMAFALVSIASKKHFKLVAALVVLAAAGFLVRFSDSLMDTSFRFGIVRCLYGFFTGTLVHKLWRWFPTRTLPMASVFELLTVLAVGVFVSTSYQNRWSFAAPLVFAGTVFVFAFEGGAVSRLLANKPFARVGAWSYSIYMIHFLMVILAHTFASVALKVLTTKAPATAAAVQSVAQGAFAQDFFALLLLGAIVFTASLSFRWIEDSSRLFFNRLATRLQTKSVAGS